MAKRPIKKRKQRAVAKKKLKHVPPLFGEEEAQIFDIPKPPIGLAYQWVLAEHVRKYHGWVQVPFDRHADEMPPETNEDGAIVYLGNVLVQREQSLVEAELSVAQKIALKNLHEHPAYRSSHPDAYGPFHILSDSFVVSSNYPIVSADSPPVDVDITIKFRVSARWQDAAAALDLDIQEYARRRLIMENPILASYGHGDERFYACVELKIIGDH